MASQIDEKWKEAEDDLSSCRRDLLEVNQNESKQESAYKKLEEVTSSTRASLDEAIDAFEKSNSKLTTSADEIQRLRDINERLEKESAEIMR